MERIEVYKVSDGTLCVEIFKDIRDENSIVLFKGENATKIINELQKEKICDVVENSKDDEIVLVYKKGVVRLNEYTDIMYKKGMRKLRDNIKKFEETKALKKAKNKKVTRKNKHIGKVIIPVSIVAIITMSTALVGYNGINSPVNTFDEYPTQSTTIVQLTHETTVTPYQEETLYQEDNSESIIEEYDVKEETTLPSVATEQEETQEPSVSLPYENNTETPKAYYSKNNYWDLIEKYSKMYGLDPNLVLAIATQERGVHSSIMDEGGATGLMQVQNAVWEYYNKTSYNFETGDYETFLITPEGIQDLEQNIKIGCTIFQECLKNMNYNIIAAIQCYNMGQGSMMDILNSYSMDTGKTIEQILNNPNDIGWLEYRNIIPWGDPEYVENVLSWLGDESTVTVLKDNGDQVSLNVQNSINEKKQVIC